MWWLQSCPEPGDGSRGHGAHGGSGAPLSQEAGAGATGHAGMHACLVFRLNSELVYSGTRSSGYRGNQGTTIPEPTGRVRIRDVRDILFLCCHSPWAVTA
jgi:hypothetical protein